MATVNDDELFFFSDFLVFFGEQDERVHPFPNDGFVFGVEAAGPDFAHVINA
jgi:hypothetical protein